MKDTRLIMDMPITIEIVDSWSTQKNLTRIFDYFKYIDDKFSTFKETSEITKINKDKINRNNYSQDMVTVLNLCEKTKQETNGYFEVSHKGKLDPSGLVKGWAIFQAYKMLKEMGFENFYIDAGGDIQVSGKNSQGKKWRIGIRNPVNRREIVKVIDIGENKGVATSGTYIRGQHIYNPINPEAVLSDILSLTVIGPDVYEADRFATAAYAMGKKGIEFIEKLPGFEGYMIDNRNVATYTSGFNKYAI
jgi:FAD:protein FMN transferase